MGNSSSQVAPTQGIQHARTPSRASTTPYQLTIDSSTIPELEGGLARTVKRQRTNESGTSGRRPKSRPQHRRGTAIQPKLGVEPLHLTGVLDDTVAVAQTQDDEVNGVQTRAEDAVAGAETVSKSSQGSEIVVNKDYVKPWQSDERQRQEQLTEIVKANSPAEKLRARNDEQAPGEAKYASPRKPRQKRQKKKPTEPQDADAEVDLDSQVRQQKPANENTDEQAEAKTDDIATARPTKKARSRKPKRRQSHKPVDEEVIPETQTRFEAVVEIPRNVDQPDIAVDVSSGTAKQKVKTQRKRKRIVDEEAEAEAEEQQERAVPEQRQVIVEQTQDLVDVRESVEEDPPQPTPSAHVDANQPYDEDDIERPLFETTTMQSSARSSALRLDAEPMPTPPESPPKQVAAASFVAPAVTFGGWVAPAIESANNPELQNDLRANPNGRIAGWLDEEEFVHPSTETTASPSPPPSSGMPLIRRAVPTQDAGPREAGVKNTVSRKRKQSSDDGNAGTEAKPKQRRVSQHNDGRGTVKGPWSADEKARLDFVWDDYIIVNHLDAFEMRAATIDWANIGPIKEVLKEAFPGRTVDSIRKYCQRHFFPFKTGPWTAEEDEKLKEAFTRCPNQWMSISDIVGRSWDSVRDRWRFIVRDRDTRKVGAWSLDEEEKLKSVVEKSMQIIRSDDQWKDKSTEEAEGAINWKGVSAKMGRTRSEKRCLEKWQNLKKDHGNAAFAALGHLKHTGHFEAIPAHEVQAVERDDSASHAPSLSQTGLSEPTNKTSKTRHRMIERQARLVKQYEQLGTGDIFDALLDIVEVMKVDLDKHFSHETTLWSEVAVARKDVSKFDNHSNLRRRAYEGALELYGHKKGCREAIGIPRKALHLMNTMLRMERKGMLVLKRTWKAPAVRRRASTGTGKVMKGSSKSRRSTTKAAVVDDTAEYAPTEGSNKRRRSKAAKEDHPLRKLSESEREERSQEERDRIYQELLDTGDYEAMPESPVMTTGRSLFSPREDASPEHEYSQLVVGANGSPLLRSTWQKKRKRVSGAVTAPVDGSGAGVESEPPAKRAKKQPVTPLVKKAGRRMSTTLVEASGVNDRSAEFIDDSDA